MQHGVQIWAPRCALELRFLMFSGDRIWHASSSSQERARLTFLRVFKVTVVDGQNDRLRTLRFGARVVFRGSCDLKMTELGWIRSSSGGSMTKYDEV